MRAAAMAVLALAGVVCTAAAPASSPRLPGTIAYSDRIWWPRSDAWEILVVDPNVGKAKALTKLLPCGDASMPAWSRDGSLIAFACSGRPWVMWHDGTGKRELSHHLGYWPSFAPDRRALVVVNSGRIAIVRLWSGSRIELFQSGGYAADWSPHGDRIAFDRGPKHRGIWTIRVDGGGLRRLTSEDDWGPAWSPDATRILFTRNGATWVMGADGGHPHRVRGADSGGVWSPDGRWIATINDSVSERDNGIWVVPATGGTPRRVSCCVGQQDGLAWGP